MSNKSKSAFKQDSHCSDFSLLIYGHISTCSGPNGKHSTQFAQVSHVDESGTPSTYDFISTKSSLAPERDPPKHSSSSGHSADPPQAPPTNLRKVIHDVVGAIDVPVDLSPEETNRLLQLKVEAIRAGIRRQMDYYFRLVKTKITDCISCEITKPILH